MDETNGTKSTALRAGAASAKASRFSPINGRRMVDATLALLADRK